jgi:GcrA cell cycle regulator
MVWSKSFENRLVSLYKRGLTYSQIASELGVSRSAVAGKVNRIQGLGKRSSRLKRDERRIIPKRNERRMPRIKSIVTQLKEPVGMAPTSRVPDRHIVEPPQTAADLPKAGQCKYAGGGPGAWTWCSEAAMSGKPYCDYHSEIVYQEPRER